MHIFRSIARGLPLCALMVVAIAAPAHADFGYLSSWSSTGSGDGQIANGSDLTTDPAGNLLVLDRQNDRVLVFNSDGVYESQFGSFGTAPGQLQGPRGIGTDSAGNVYVLDSQNSRIEVFDSSHVFSRTIPITGSGWAMAVSPTGNDIYLSSGNSAPFITRLDGSGNTIGQWGSVGSGNGQFANIYGLAVDAQGNVYAGDDHLERVEKFTSDGTFIGQTSTPSEYQIANALAIDAAGNMWISDGAGERVRQFSTDGTLLRAFAACNGGTAGGVTVAASGRVYAHIGSHLKMYGEGGAPTDPACSSTGGTSAPPSAQSPTGPIPPDGPTGVTINNGAQYTNDPNVTLSVVWPLGIQSVLVANDGGFQQGHSFAATPTIPWHLPSSGPERLPKTVYVRFDGSAPNYTDDIVLDQTPPTISAAQLVTGSSSRAIAAGAHSYKIKLRARDKTSGVGKVQIATRTKRRRLTTKYRTTLHIRMTGTPHYVRVRDRAGNWSRWKALKG